MLESLRIENLGTISSVALEFGPGFTVITGETGAGKTMLLTSLDWLLGAKVEPALVSHGAQKAVVEGSFLVDDVAGAVVEEAGGVVEDGVAEVSRVVPLASRSKAHLGGRTVPAAILGEFGASLVSVHGQAAQSRLRTERAQRDALDAYGDAAHQRALEQYLQDWEVLSLAQKAFTEWETSAEKREHRREVLERFCEEFDSLRPEDGEFTELSASVAKLSNVESLRENVAAALGAIEADSTPAATDLVAVATRSLQRATEEDPSLQEVAQSVSGAGYALDDAARELGVYLQDLNADPEALQEALSRRAAFTDLSLRLGVEPERLGTAWRDTATELQGLQGGTEHLEQLRLEMESAAQAVEQAGAKLHEAREKTARALSKAINAELVDLDMKDTRVTVEVRQGEPGAHGADRIEFMLRPHPKAPVLALSSAASGGELSRIMLALEVTLAGRGSRLSQTGQTLQNSQSTEARGTFVFDEVDAGIGGQAGIEVGRRLSRLAQDYQVIVVTHLAQVAAFGDCQVQITKSGGQSRITVLDQESRREELARMISGTKLTKTALAHADELIELARMGQSES
ncbi:DNA repair protein RecN [Mobiluncus sp.]|uniref:DNA repair protein RecN n=1 Tax=Mobiluncus sp. TaxID=47293 RepID=UPI002A915121|nr:DNA repair protein RecN [Mobiluncus sp.]MDY6077011.1 DNA repair protein RecN [Mobiluncus sp.]